MRALWAVVAGLAVGGGTAWWLARDTPQQASAKRERASQAARQQAEDARPSLYRWRDAAGILQITDTPPTDRPYQRIEHDQTPVISVHGARDLPAAE
jgi:hypothetical protein